MPPLPQFTPPASTVPIAPAPPVQKTTAMATDDLQLCRMPMPMPMPMPTSSCHPEVAALVEALFRPDWQKQKLAEYGYNSIKLPPEQIDRTVIRQAMVILESLMLLLPWIQDGLVPREVLLKPSARFFTLIPHTKMATTEMIVMMMKNMSSMDDDDDGGFPYLSSSGSSSSSSSSSSSAAAAALRRLLHADTMDKIQEKIDLLRLLTTLERQQSLVLARQWSEHQQRMHPIDWLVDHLHVSRLVYLEPTTEAARMIRRYVRGTLRSGSSSSNNNKNHSNCCCSVHGVSTHGGGGGGGGGGVACRTLDILSAFEVECKHAERGFFRYNYNTMHNRRLLWHGTRAANLVSILSRGFKLPLDPLGSAHGASFGPGIYFTDFVQKAASYCGVHCSCGGGGSGGTSGTKNNNNSRSSGGQGSTGNHHHSRHGGVGLAGGINSTTDDTIRSGQTAYLLLCEVALGKSIDFDVPTCDAMALMVDARKNSVFGRGRAAPNPEKHVLVDRDVLVPLGELVESKQMPPPRNNFNEV
ncbi:hypothetical protein DFQ26_002663 [Actinomortierella ambigua]|nr:hypothetical protein DFQ26_002663 [Actinomortierella ambigua]